MVCHNNICNEVIGARDSATGLGERDESSHPASADEDDRAIIVARTLHLTQKEGLFVDHDTDCVLLGPTLQPDVRQQ
jgi:hypothetical protein